ncbi:MAG: hypothetical protein HYV32_03250 [Candidatus Kerfeldbacteria bacterium]|nr:hypothetical protein [Candidatus Kerfeldbacteria bacterium]
MQKSLKIIILVFCALAVVGLIVAGILFARRSSTDDNNTNTQNTNEQQNTNNALPNVNSGTGGDGTNTNTGGDNTNTDTTAQTTQEELVMRLARIVVERYGSFSNRNNYENITRLEPFMTEEFQQESLAFIEKNHTDGIPEDYYGISTTANSVELTAYTAKESATARVGTRRVETKTNEDPRAFTQYALVDFLYVNGNWKVDNITWQ